MNEPLLFSWPLDEDLGAEDIKALGKNITYKLHKFFANRESVRISSDLLISMECTTDPGAVARIRLRGSISIGIFCFP